ncbi:hypothetical protein [Candidatus Ruthturnera calyptogenae]|uniref:hypothetical protein n=1 Tax=Candidatus Ruthturnera calyptogenae TaxID=386487 RepID=UPI0011D0E0FE|nr:hypothetical protein [Candidatus Ruthturnera calyptogenae]
MNNSTIAVSGVSETAQQGINFISAYEWEADRMGTKILLKYGFDPKGMAQFFLKIKDNPGANEFLCIHLLSINRISDSIQRFVRERSDY